MTILPELERAPVQAAKPHTRRRSAARPIAALAVAAVAAFAAVGARAWWPADTAEQTATAPVAPQQPADALSSSYSVFSRPRVARDQLPKPFGAKRVQPVPDTTVDYGQSRLVATATAARAYALPATKRSDKPAVCLLVALNDGGGGFGCSDHSSAGASKRLPGQRLTVSGKSLYFYLTPDGVREVRLTLRDGSTVTGRAQDNGVLIGPTRGAQRVTWIDTAGKSHSERQHDDPDDTTD
jgi:hypothetical protein